MRKNGMKNTTKPETASFDYIATGKQYNNNKTRLPKKYYYGC